MTKTTYGGVCSATRRSRAVFQARSRARAAESALTLLWGLSPRVRFLQANRQYGRQQTYFRRPRVRWRGRVPLRSGSRRRSERLCGSAGRSWKRRWRSDSRTRSAPTPRPSGTSPMRSASSCSGMLSAPGMLPPSYSLGLTDVQDHEVLRAQGTRRARRSRRRGRTELPSRPQVVDVTDRGTGESVDADPDEFPSGLGDLVGALADEGQRSPHS